MSTTQKPNSIRSLLHVFNLYRTPIAIWVAIQIAFISYYRSVILSGPEVKDLPGANTMAIVYILGALAGYGPLVAFLGHLFNTSSRTSWLRQLPLSASVYTFAPIALLFSYGLALTLLIPWGFFRAGLPIFTFLIPMISFLIIKNARSFFAGLIAAAVFTVLTILAWAYLLWGWSLTRSPLKTDTVALIAGTALMMWVARRERKYALVAPLSIALFFGAQILHASLRTPSTYMEAVNDLFIAPSEKTREAFRKAATDPAYWQTFEQSPQKMSHYGNYISQRLINNHLNSDEKIQLLQNVARSFDTWKETRFPGVLLLEIYPSPSAFDRIESTFPINRRNADEKLTDYVYEHWREEPLFPSMLPLEPSDRFFDKIFNSKRTFEVESSLGAWSKYQLFDEGEYEKLADKYLVSPHRDAKHSRRPVAWSLVYGWRIRDTLSTEEIENIQESGMTSESLALLKQKRREVYRRYLQPLFNADKDEFKSAIRPLDPSKIFSTRNVESPKKSPETILHPHALALICDQVIPDCENAWFNRISSDRGWLEAWKDAFSTIDSSDRDGYAIKQELLKDENWPKIQKLLEQTKNSQY